MGKKLRSFWPFWASVTVTSLLLVVFVVRSQPSTDPCPLTWERIFARNAYAVEEGFPSATVEGMQQYREYYCDLRALRDTLTKENYSDRAFEYRYNLWELNYLANKHGISWMQGWSEPTEEQIALWLDVRTVAEYLAPQDFTPEDPNCGVEYQNNIGECQTEAETPFGTIQLSWSLDAEKKSLHVFNERFQFQRQCLGEFVPDTFEELFDCPVSQVSYHVGYNWALDCFKLDASWHDIGLVLQWNEQEGKTCDVPAQILPDNIDEIIASSK